LRVAALEVGAAAAASVARARCLAAARGLRHVAHGRARAGGDDAPARERIVTRFDICAGAAPPAHQARVAALAAGRVAPGGAAVGDDVEPVAARAALLQRVAAAAPLAVLTVGGATALQPQRLVA